MNTPQSSGRCSFPHHWWEDVVSRRDSGIPARLTRLALGALSGPYWLGLKANLALYATKLRRRTQPALPVVSVGNLTLGGTGKTTAVQFLARRLQEAGTRPAVVLRGYRAGRTGQPIILAGSEYTELPEVAEVGDEAYLLAQALANVPVGVGKHREAVIAELAAQARGQVVLLDDGFQYFRMNRLFDIVLVDATVDLSRQRLFPAGYLREPLSHLRRADQIWITHCDLVAQSELAGLNSTVARLSGDLPVVETIHEITGLRMLSGQEMTPDEIVGMRLLAVSAIGNAQAFEQSLSSLGAEVISLRYNDHHYYCPEDLAHIDSCAREHDAELVAITPKDAVKWPRGTTEIPVAVVDCQLRITKGEQAVTALIASVQQVVSDMNNGR